MPQRSFGLGRALVVALVALATGLAALHLRYPLPYVYRVLVYQDSDFDDIERFPAREIRAAEFPSRLTVAINPQVASVFEQQAEVGDLDRFLERTQTTAFLVVHRGRLVQERYLAGHDRDRPQNTFSVSKAIASALIGLATGERLIELEAPITRYAPELGEREPRFAEITLEHLLDMRSGIRYAPGVQFPFVQADDALTYYHPNLEVLILERTEIASAPGEFQYNNYNTPLLGLALRRATGLSPAEYLERRLWRPMGAERSAGWLVDDRGFERMESGFFARGRDLARFGQLYLDGGRVEGRQVLPESWVFESTRLSEPMAPERYNGRSWGYRAGWWLVPRPEGRADFCAIGRYGQFVYVSPQNEVVFVRTGPGRGDHTDRDWTELFYSVAEQL